MPYSMSDKNFGEIVTSLDEGELIGEDSEPNHHCTFYCCPTCHTDMRSAEHMARGNCD